MTPLDKTLKRLLCIRGVEYVVTLSPETLKLTRKGRRLGMELKWADITSGESALAIALRASVGRFAKNEELPNAAVAVATTAPRRGRRPARALWAKRP